MSNQKVNLAQISHKLVSRGKAKTKKTKSLFDTPLVERNYWGDGKDIELIMGVTRNAIRRSLESGFLFDFDNEAYVLILDDDKKKELISFQLELIANMQIDHEVKIIQNNLGQWLIEKS